LASTSPRRGANWASASVNFIAQHYTARRVNWQNTPTPLPLTRSCVIIAPSWFEFGRVTRRRWYA